jgi:hypothetical protein
LGATTTKPKKSTPKKHPYFLFTTKHKALKTLKTLLEHSGTPKETRRIKLFKREASNHSNSSNSSGAQRSFEEKRKASGTQWSSVGKLFKREASNVQHQTRRIKNSLSLRP